MHLNDAYEIAILCSNKYCTVDDYDRIYQELKKLQAQAHSMDYRVMDKFAMAMATFAHYLQNKIETGISPKEQDLLIEGIRFGLRCSGHNQEKCPAMHFDELWPLLEKISHHMQQTS